MTLYSFLRDFILRPLFKILFRFNAFGRENLPKTGGFILASNHVSLIDPVALGIASFRELHFMAKESLFKNKFFGSFLYKINVFPIKRQRTDPGAIKEAVKRLKGGKPLVIFPEGGRSTDGSLQEPKFGVGFLAHLAGVPTIPCFVKGSAEALPKHAKFIRPKRVTVYFGKPILLEENISGIDKKESYQTYAQKAMEQIEFLGRQNVREEGAG